MATQFKVAPEKSAESLSDRVRPHLAEIAKRAAATEEARMVPAENIEIIKNAGFVRSFVPKERGGDERSIRDYCEGVRTLSKACPSTGWVTGVLNVHQAGIVHARPEVQDDVWKNGPDTVIASSGSPAMKAELADGGIIVNGKGRWSSGCDHAEWFMVGIKIPNVAEATYAERNYRDCMFLVHRSKLTIEDEWYSKGMRGSGSKTLVFDNLFVPQEYYEGQDSLTLGLAHGAGTVDNWISRVPYFSIFASFLPAVALGCADGMLDQFRTWQRRKKNAYTGAYTVLNAVSNARLAEATHEVEMASVYYYHLLDEMERRGREGIKLDEEAFWAAPAKLAYVTKRAVHAINMLFEGAGASAVADFNPMQRYWRDGNTVRLHQGMDYDTAVQNHGRFLMGLPPTPDL